MRIESEWESGEAREAAADIDVKGVRTPVRNVLESAGVWGCGVFGAVVVWCTTVAA